MDMQVIQVSFALNAAVRNRQIQAAGLVHAGMQGIPGSSVQSVAARNLRNDDQQGIFKNTDIP